MSCCAPCSAGALLQLKESPEIADFIVLFYNPNIFPESEYHKRLAEQIRLCNELGVKYAVHGADDYKREHAKWRECVRGMEDQPERGKRCAACFEMRFAFGVRWARDNGYNAITSVFGVSKWKDQFQVDTAARNAAKNDEQIAIDYIPIQWDDDLRQKTVNKSDFYRQKYCGCEFSFKEPTKKLSDK